MTPRRTLFLINFGAGLEHYDFILYGFLGVYLSQAFFPQAAHGVQLLHTLLVFAVGYLARPIGGLFIGAIADRHGRSKVYLAVILLMGLATTGIGLLPSFASIGFWSPLILVVLRLIQGLTFGADIPGAVTMFCEYNARRSGLLTAAMLTAISLGILICIALINALSQTLSHAAMQDYGWRVPFVLGGGIALLNYFLRRHIIETPAFLVREKQAPLSQPPWQTLFAQYPGALFSAFIVLLFPAAFILFGVSLPSFAHLHFGLTPNKIYPVMLFGYTVSALSLIPFGLLADRIGYRKQLLCTLTLAAALSAPLFNLLQAHTSSGFMIFVACYQLIISALTTSYLPLLASRFPTAIRFSAIGLSYNIAFCAAALAPYWINQLLLYQHGIAMTAMLFTGLALLSLAAVARESNPSSQALCFEGEKAGT